RKVVNSGKRLRAHVGIDEGNVGDDHVCSSCNLRGNCERAFVKAREDEGGRTVDVMRIILTYGLDPIIGSVDNKPSLNKMVKESVRRLLKKIVECSAEEKNPNFPDTNEVAVEEVHRNPQDKGKKDVPMKQGDWLCPKYGFISM
ncbi:zinc finger protein VAR3 chloroplastic-like, partial [Trifolium medium]|nr:zinc finger protein VAR3 chloroplastic-like [Trifolium medium]